MEADKSILLQKQVRNNSSDLQNEFLDMKNWEAQMKKADMEIRNAGGDQILPPVRRKKKASKDTTKALNKENNVKSKRIKSSDYTAWEKFDINKACDEVDKEGQTDESEDEPLSKEELEKNHAEATEHKVTGNNFVKQQNWAKAVGFYSKAIQIFPYDAVFFANRALCHLKMDNLHSAEADCTAAVQLDEFYVKAYHRRATARIALKQYKEAAQDINMILKLEPSNKEAQSMLVKVNKSIENEKPLVISSMFAKVADVQVEKKIGEKLWAGAINHKKIDEISEKETKVLAKTEIKENNENKIEPEKKGEVAMKLKLPEWLPEVHEDVEIVKVIKKPPHQRSKKPLRTVPIEEIEFGAKQTHLLAATWTETVENDEKKEDASSRLAELEAPCDEIPGLPKTAVQFLSTWRKNKSTEFRHKYLKQIPAENIPILFQDSMESNTFSEILKVLRFEFTKCKEPILHYIRYLSQVKRFRTLTMFMSKSDKEDVRALFEYSKTVEGQSDDIIKDLQVKYEV